MDQQTSYKQEHTYILYLVLEGYKAKCISSDEKRKIKELLMLRHPKIYDFKAHYDLHGNPNDFWQDLRVLCHHINLEECSTISDTVSSRDRTYSLIFELKEEEKEDFREEFSEDCCDLHRNLSTADEAGELSSPLDNALVRQKKKHFHCNKESIEKQAESRIEHCELNDFNYLNNSMQSITDMIQMCEEGLSPQVITRKS